MLNEVNAKKETAVKTSDLPLQLRNRNSEIGSYLFFAALLLLLLLSLMMTGWRAGQGRLLYCGPSPGLNPNSCFIPRPGWAWQRAGWEAGLLLPGIQAETLLLVQTAMFPLHQHTDTRLEHLTILSVIIKQQ